MRPAGVLAFFGLTGCLCGPDRLQASPGGLEFEPAQAHVAAPVQVVLRSTVPRALDVVLSVPAPFAVSPAQLSLPAQGSATVTVTVDAPQGGRFAARLDARAGAQTASEALTADLPCPAAPSCQVTQVDAASGACVVAAAADGTACSDPCLDDAHCSSGVCVGSAKQCADTDLCTVDACEKGAGCVHLTCAAIEDPCRSGVCTATGCVFDPLPDGTACGPADCVEARVCLAGTCGLRPVPEGAACTTPCGAGVCASSECVLPAGTALTSDWTLPVGPAFNVASPLAADAAGNVYWLEAGATTDHLVSVSAEGTRRWSVSLGLEQRSFSTREVLVDDAAGVVVFSEAGGRLEARKLTDGSAAWTRTIAGDLMTAPDVAPGDRGYLGTVAGGTVLVANTFLYPPTDGSPKRQQLFGLDPATGKTRWKTAQSAFAGVVMDEASNSYLRVHSAGTWALLSYSPAGVARWSGAPVAVSEVKAVFDGRLYLAHGEGIATATGAAAFPAPFVPDDETTFGSLQYLEGEWLAGKGVAYLALGQYAAPRGIDPQSGALKWIRKSSSYRPTDALLTATGTRLVLDQRHLGPMVGWRWHVSALTPAGREAWACMLPDYGWYELTGVSLVAQRLVVTGRAVNPVPMPYPLHTGVAAFALPGVTIAPGWSVTSAGALARTHRPQPKP